MARNLRDIRRKMKAIKSTKQVTKAMELVAASKMRKAVQNAQTLRSYALSAWEMLQTVAEMHREVHPFLMQKPVERVLVILFTSDRGLCGNLNAQIFRSVSQYLGGLSALASFKNIEFITVGRKGHQHLTRQGHKVIATFPALSNHPVFKDVLPITKLAMEGFRNETYDHVVLVYTDFISPLVQETAVKVLLPFSRSEMRKMISSVLQRKSYTREEQRIRERPVEKLHEYKFEPSTVEIIETIMPHLTEIQVFQAVLESVASEHSSRMIAMRNATDNANDIIEELNQTYNQTRQANITAELAELSGAAAALG